MPDPDRSYPTPSAPRGSHRAPASRRPAAALGLAAVGLLVTGLAWQAASPAYAAEAEVNLRTAQSFAVLAGSAVTNTGPSVVSGDLGLSPGSAVSGFPPGTVIAGTQHVGDAVASRAQDDLTTAYNDAAGRSTTRDVTGSDLGGMVLTSGVYAHTSGMQLTGTVTLDAQGDPDAVFVLKAGSTLVTASGSTVALVNGASPCNVFWQVGSSATLGSGTDFVGTVLALTSATLGTGADVEGRILARNGAVTLDTNDITAPGCAAVPPTSTPSATPTATPTTKPTATPTPTSDPTATASPSATPTATVPTPSTTPVVGPGPAEPTTTDTTVPVHGPGTPPGSGGGPPAYGPPTYGPPAPGIPVGHPETGFGPVQPRDHGPLTMFALALAAGAGAVGAAFRSMRVPHRH